MTQAGQDLSISKLAYDEGQHPLRFSDAHIRASFVESLFRELIAHPRFQRLKDVRFLGAIDYAVSANGRPLHTRQTRFDHSIGVGLLAQWYADEAGFADSERYLLVSSALLHDIGHAPLSHSLETVFKEAFGIDHHIATIDTIRERKAKSESISSILQKYSVDPEAVIATLSNKAGQYAPLLLGKFNLDTLDAIPRSVTYISKQLLTSPSKVVMRAAHFNAGSRQDALDSFWSQKDLVYQRLINGALGVQFDRNAQDFMREHIANFSRADFFASEVDLRRSHPQLFSRLAQPRWDTVTLAAKRYLIDRDQPFDEKRYLIVREPITISFEKRPKELLVEDPESPRLFRDDIQIRSN